MELNQCIFVISRMPKYLTVYFEKIHVLNLFRDAIIMLCIVYYTISELSKDLNMFMRIRFSKRMMNNSKLSTQNYDINFIYVMPCNNEGLKNI